MGRSTQEIFSDLKYSTTADALGLIETCQPPRDNLDTRQRIFCKEICVAEAEDCRPFEQAARQRLCTNRASKERNN